MYTTLRLSKVMESLSFSCEVYRLAMSLALLLLLSGDVETNPGPKPDTIPRSFLSELVKLPVAAKWRELGLQLGAPTYKLDSIQLNNHNKPNFAQQCLTDMFDWWLNNSSKTTFAALAKALHTQGLEVFDSGKNILCPAYAPRQHLKKEIKFLVAHKWNDIGNELGVPKNVLDTIKQEYQKYLSSEVDSDQWCFLKTLKWWKQNGPAAVVNLQEFFKALHELDEHDKERKIKEIHYNSHKPTPPEPIARPDLPECIVRYSEYLREKYLAQPVLPDSGWPPSLGGQFIRLALIPRQRDVYAEKYDAVLKIQRDYVRGNVDKILAGRSNEKTEMRADQIFNPLYCLAGGKLSLRILIDGAPGVGKTTLSRKFTQDWASGNTGKLLQEYDLVVLLHLRDKTVSQASTIDDFFYHDDPDLNKSVVKHVRKTSGKRVLLIFDGFDELSAAEREHGSFFMNIIEGKVLIKCSVVVTSRPYASVELQELSSINRHIEVLGFTEEMIKQCIVKTIKDNPDKAQELCTQLHERLDIMSLCYIPLNCAIMLFVYQQENFILPKTLTELYNIFVLHAIKRHTKNLFGATKARRIRCLDKLPKEIEPTFSILCELGYKSLIKDQLVFHEEDIEEAFPDIGDQDIERQTLALMTVAKSYSRRGREVTCNFLHLTIHEFLAAKWAVADLSPTEMSNLLKQHLMNDRFRMMLLFAAGIAKDNFPNLDEVFADGKSYLKTCPPNYTFLLLCHLAYESTSHSFSVHLTNSVKRIKLAIELSYQALSEFELLVVLTFISKSECQWDSLKFKCKEQHLEMYREVCSNTVFEEVNLEFDGKKYAILKEFLEIFKLSTVKLHITDSFGDPNSITTLLSLTSIPNLSKLSFLSVIYTQCHTQAENNDTHPKRTLSLSHQLSKLQFSTVLTFFQLHSSYHLDLVTLDFNEPPLKNRDRENEGEFLCDVLKQCELLNTRVRVTCDNKKILSAIIPLEMSNLSVSFCSESIVYKSLKTFGSEQRRDIEARDPKCAATVLQVIFASGVSWDTLKLKCGEWSLDDVTNSRVLDLQIKDMYLEFDSNQFCSLLSFLKMVSSIQNIEIKATACHSREASKSPTWSCIPAIIESVKNISKFSSFSTTSDGATTCFSVICNCHKIIKAMYSNTNMKELRVVFYRKRLDSLKNLLQRNTSLSVLEIFVELSDIILPSRPGIEDDYYYIQRLIEFLEKPLSINKTLTKFIITWKSGSVLFERDPETSMLAISQTINNLETSR